MSRIRWRRGGGGCFQIFLLGFGHRKTNILLLNWNFWWLPSPSHLKVRPKSKSLSLSLLGHVSFAVVFLCKVALRATFIVKTKEILNVLIKHVTISVASDVEEFCHRSCN